MDEKLENVIHEYEKVTGNSASIDHVAGGKAYTVDKIYMLIPLGTFVALLIFRPKFLYIKTDLNGKFNFSYSRLLSVTLIISACIIVGYYLHKAKVF